MRSCFCYNIVNKVTFYDLNKTKKVPLTHAYHHCDNDCNQRQNQHLSINHSLEQETLPSLLSTGWFQEQIWAWFQSNWNKFRALWKIDLKVKLTPIFEYICCTSRYMYCHNQNKTIEEEKLIRSRIILVWKEQINLQSH